MFTRLIKSGFRILPGLLIPIFLFSGCLSHIEKGWNCYDLADFQCAKTEFQKSEEPNLAEKVVAAEEMIRLYSEIKQAEASKDNKLTLNLCKELIAHDKWDDKTWLHRTKDKEHDLMVYLKYAYKVRKKMNKYFKDLAYAKKMTAAYDKKVKCGKDYFDTDQYEKALKCLASAKEISKGNPGLKLNTDEVEYLSSAAVQAIEIQKAIEEELKKEEERQKKLEEERRRIVEAKIKKARAKEAERLRQEEAERRKLEEAQRKQAELDRKWRLFLKKGRPLKPLVSTLKKPSYGKGKIKVKQKEKWQGGAQLPKSKNRAIKSEDIYALGIEIPKGYKLNYLRNYKSTDDLLQVPVSQGASKFYYTEGYKGGRFYTEVQRGKKGKRKYKIKTTIYKIPVTN